jgi:hypothetical protein
MHSDRIKSTKFSKTLRGIPPATGSSASNLAPEWNRELGGREGGSRERMGQERKSHISIFRDVDHFALRINITVFRNLYLNDGALLTENQKCSLNATIRQVHEVMLKTNFHSGHDLRCNATNHT